jgi:hypothetical protein
VVAITCPNPACGSMKFVSEAAIDMQIDEDESYQCSTCGHRWDPYAEPEQAKHDASSAEGTSQDWIGKPKK